MAHGHSPDWWKTEVIYHIYLPSFKDSNDDGIGDFPGLTSKLDYFDYLNVKTLMISPFFPSPMKDNGYDVTDFVAVDPKYGTMEDFDYFMKCAKDKGIHVLMDFPLNHTSERHDWFLKSIEKVFPYTDYYIWVDPKYTQSDVLPPNNWISVFGGSAWEWNQERQQYYLHQFLDEQPDLNLRNPLVRKELIGILKFWLDKGIDGFRIDAASHLFEDEELKDEPLSSISIRSKYKSDEYNYLEHLHTYGHPENLVLLKEWKDLLSDYQKIDGRYRLLLAEVTETVQDTMRYYGTTDVPLVDIPFNFLLTHLDSDATAKDLHKAITSWMDAIPVMKCPNWILSNHDVPRLASKVGPDRAFGFHMVVLLLPGVAFSYYGDEIGMEKTPITALEMKDSFAIRTRLENSRDPSRTPMHWDSSKFAGFTDSDVTWLPVNNNYKTINVEAQKSEPYSLLEIYRQLISLREQPAFQNGALFFPLVDGNLFSMVRLLSEGKSILLVFNMGLCACVANFSKKTDYLPKEAIVEITNNTGFGNQAEQMIEEGDCPVTHLFKAPIKLEDTQQWKVNLRGVFMLPNEAMVLSFKSIT